MKKFAIAAPSSVVASSISTIATRAAEDVVMMLKQSDIRDTYAKRLLAAFQQRITDDVLSKAHVYDFGRIFDPTGEEQLPSYVEEYLKADSGKAPLFLPHANTIFITRYGALPPNPWRICIAVMTETKSQLQMDHLVYTEANPDWQWLGGATVRRATGFVEEFHFEGREHSSSRARQACVGQPLMCIALLNCKKSGVVDLEPSAWEYTDPLPDKPDFKTPNPLVLRVHVNTARLRLAPSGAGPTGAKVKPHDRRAHPMTRGNQKITRRGSKVNGGAPRPAIKIVEVED
jgi:hypothetical protein